MANRLGKNCNSTAKSFFEIRQDDDGIKKYFCIMKKKLNGEPCNAKLSIQNDGSTGHLNTHLNRTHPGWRTQRTPAQKRGFHEGNEEPDILTALYNQPIEDQETPEARENPILKEILASYIECNTPFRCIEHESQRKILRRAYPDIRLPGR